jgi:hypothetical protein
VTIHVIATCSKRKKLGLSAVCLSGIKRKRIETRAHAWVRALEESNLPTVAARDLYQGEQWSLLRQLERQTTQPGVVKYWVLSAGYGLISFGAPLRPYSATFSKGHPDSVFDPGYGLPMGSVVDRWLDVLTEWEGPAGGPRSLPELIKDDPECTVMLAASPIYVSAVQEQLKAAASLMASADRLLVFSAGSESRPGVEGPDLLAFGGDLRARLGGSLMSLNVRVLAAVLRLGEPLDRPTVQRTLDEWMRDAPRWETPKRAPLKDQEVRRFLRRELKREPGVQWTPLLRRLRNANGHACEQKRFRALFHEVAGGLA